MKKHIMTEQDVINYIKRNPNYENFFEDKEGRIKSMICNVAGIQIQFFMSLGSVSYDLLQNPDPNVINMDEVISFAEIAKRFLEVEAARRERHT